MTKKYQIASAAVKVFQEKGIENTKVSDIVKEAGVAQGTFYLYYPSKLSVMPVIAEEMVMKMLGEIERQVPGKATFAEQLEQVVNIVFKLTSEYRDVFALVYAGLASTKYLQSWETIYAPYYDWMSEFLSKAKASGNISELIHPEQSAVLLIGLIESAAEQLYLYSHAGDQAAELKKKEVTEFAARALGMGSCK
ncbi:TetR family transcriptional regulator [Virgibacillus halophilus]|uniref:TetR family transcriptional regulator n=1 Tax=Tigheibacillus halophilus TaxID=361280 RepID=A0ABU5C4V7_9BACI|nr:TetR family transcriptional regulator [Virgibacillus halophilus]